MTIAHRFITFETISDSKSLLSGGIRPAAVNPLTGAAVGNHFSFGSGPSNHKPGSIGQGRARNRVTCSAAAEFNLRRMCRHSSAALPFAARARLKLSQLAQAVIDGFAVLFLFGFGALLFGASAFAVATVGALLLLFKF